MFLANYCATAQCARESTREHLHPLPLRCATGTSCVQCGVTPVWKLILKILSRILPCVILFAVLKHLIKSPLQISVLGAVAAQGQRLLVGFGRCLALF